jgi:hypothetical protein
MSDELPDSVRYVKNGGGGRWWPVAHARGQVHAGWSDVPVSALTSNDMRLVADTLRNVGYADGRRGLLSPILTPSHRPLLPPIHRQTTLSDVR